MEFKVNIFKSMKLNTVQVSKNEGLFYGPYDIESLRKNVNFTKKTKNSGIYVWGVKYESRYYPVYVGKSENICERIFQHIIRFSGGEYLIPSKKLMIDPNRNYTLIRKNLNLDNGLLYYPTGNFDYRFLNKKNIVETVSFFKKNFFVCWKEITKYNKQNSAIEEGNLANAIGKQKLIGLKYRESNGDISFIQDFLKLRFI